jgi:predicted metal-dependent enzyme (double-stranded beta helix superfamily)
MFDRDRFIEDCQGAIASPNPARDMREVVARAVSDPTALMASLGAPEHGGLGVIHRSETLTILNVQWQPKMVIMPHNHNMAAVIGVYSGREDNILWRRLPEDGDGRIEGAGAKTLSAKDTLVLGADVIHSVINPIPRITGAIHVYSGDFFAAARSEWDPETLREMPYDMQKVMRMFAGQA